MIKHTALFVVLAAAALFACGRVLGQESLNRKARALVVVGGHAVDEKPFHAMLDSRGNMTWIEVKPPNAHAWLAPEKAEEYAEFIDVVLRRIIANYLGLSYMYAGSDKISQSYDGLTYGQMYELLAALLPEAEGPDVRTVIDAASIETEGPGILKTMLESNATSLTDALKDRSFSPEIFKNPTFYLNESKS